MPLLEVGRIDKPHGVKGEVVVSLSTDREERVAAGSVLRLRSGRSLTITSSKPLQHRWIVRFAEIPDRNAADDVHGEVLLAEPLAEAGDDTLWVHELIGCEVVEDGARLGEVTSVEENPASDLLVLDTGHLIPLRFVTDHDVDAKRVTVDLPAGLLEL